MRGSQGPLPYAIETVDERTLLTPRAGLPLFIETMRALQLDSAIREALLIRRRQIGRDEVVHVEALMMLIAAGGECVDDLDVLRSDQALQALWHESLPSPDAARQFLYRFHDSALIEAAKVERAPEQKAFIPRENAALAGLGRVNEFLVHEVSRHQPARRATLDHDATIVESHKREALPHYKGGRGYQPAVIYWVEQDLAVADEFRDGNVPAAMDNLPLIQRGFASLPSCVQERYFRADSACYEETILKWLANEQRVGGPQGPIRFSISADMSPQLRRACEEVPESSWTLVEQRVEEQVACAEVEFTPGDWPKQAAPLRYLAVRLRKRQEELLEPASSTRYLAVVSNRTAEEISGPALLHWHWQKAGTIEHVHDVMKNDLAAGVMPCGRFGANAAWFRLNLLVYNVLSAQKQLALPAEFHDARPKRLRFRLFNLPGRVVRHAGRLILKLGRDAERLAGLIAARARLGALRTASSTA